MKNVAKDFWKTKKLEEMTSDEWEALCDNCGLCCLHRVILDDDSIAMTCVVCKNYDLKNKRCADYKNRFEIVPECIKLTLDKVAIYDWLPSTCAYRLIYQNLPLLSWHPLISGTIESMLNIGLNERDFILESDDIEIEDHIID
ncbi:conserved hypothetical protein [Sulfurovum sp. enrichment culture clone C5]|uniref:Uncharacterized protein n=1 Tax=Sulfurovum sp. enrichment culture clone C5 TaxID=497650 RepID=A0A0S4XN99_9BACT|nr:conserved hypothetical protein [Sulfurovum sp. enrichment culture clone C5]